MKVVFVPDGSKSNPYQSSLAEALKNLGVDVKLFSGLGKLPLLTVLKYYQPDIIHLHWIHGFIVSSSKILTLIRGFRFLFELWILKSKGVKLIWTVHNILEHERRNPNLELFFIKKSVKYFDRIIVHCKYALDAVMKTYCLPEKLRSRIYVIPHGNYIGQYPNSVSREEARRFFSISEEDIVFLFLGQIRPYKGVLNLIESFSKLDMPNVRLIIAGKPLNQQLKYEIEKKASNNSRIILKLEFVPDEKLQIYLNAADIVVFPYHDILTSGSIVLAMSFGLPIISPKLGCVAEIVEENKGGILYDPTNSAGLLESMRKIQKLNKEDLSKMGMHNLQKAKELDWGTIADLTLGVYKR